ncbi:MAG TPA: error-prone DNA polymerase [Acidobacteriota bacterium]
MYIELHAASAFSFLEASALPEQLVEAAAAFGYSALALLDCDGVYGAPRFYKAAQKLGVRPLVGSEITLQIESRKSQVAGRRSSGPQINRSQAKDQQAAAPFDLRPDLRTCDLRPATCDLAFRLPLLVENQTGYRNLCRLVTGMKLRAEKGAGSTTMQELEFFHPGLICLTGGSNGPLRRLLRQKGLDTARNFLARLVSIFGKENVYVELQRHFLRQQEEENQALITLAQTLNLPLLATNGVRYVNNLRIVTQHAASLHSMGRELLDVLTCIRHKTNLDQAGTLLQQNSECFLKPPAQIERIFADLPGAVANSVELASRLNFTLKDLGYRFPPYPVPTGESMATYLRHLTHMGGLKHYGVKDARAWKQIGRELDLIEKLDLAGYFLIVWDIVRFCREAGILVQGRGSAANSAVCYSLGITAVDPIRMDLLFERFLSEERGEWPDIDLDLPSGDRRERAIQYVYDRYGKHGAAMTANVITYRDRSAAREVGKALSFPPEQIDRLSRLMSTWGYREDDPSLWDRFSQAGFDPAHPRIGQFARLWIAIQDLPRHLGQHSGGMVICEGSLDSVVPLENATMPGRVVVQWDKEDCADMGIIKVDLLGLGMMSVLQDSIQLISTSCGDQVDLAHLPADDPKVYRMLQQADTIGLFQVESRAQMATLPRLKPERFYDLVVEVAIIRPGPIVGNMVHPYLNRRAGREEICYPHPSLEPILKRTLGVPLFQEQLLRVAMVAANFSGGEAEELRRAMGFKRSEQRMQAIEVKLRRGMAQNGITGKTADEIIQSITSFALYGFPESHAASFALLAYASAYLKTYYPAAFYAALLNNQPMGFYHPATLVKDAQRHGVRVKPVDVQRSDYDCTIEADRSLRLGLRMVSGMRAETGKRIAEERAAGPFVSVEDLKRTGVRRNELTTLAEIGALNSLGLRRRSALWEVEKIARPAGALFEIADFSNAECRMQKGVGCQVSGIGEAVGASGTVIRHLSETRNPKPQNYPNPDPPYPDTRHPIPDTLTKIPNSDFRIPHSNNPQSEIRNPQSDCPLKDMTPEERIISDYRGTGVTVGPHPMALYRSQLDILGVCPAGKLYQLLHGKKVRIAGSVITRQRPGTAKGFFFVTLEDETGVSNAIIRPQMFEQQRALLVSAPSLLIEGKLQSVDGVVSVKAEKVELLNVEQISVPSHDFH